MDWGLLVGRNSFYINSVVYGVIPMLQNNIGNAFAKDNQGVDGVILTDTSSSSQCATSPSWSCDSIGQSVEYVPQWFVIRATQGRAEKVYKGLMESVTTHAISDSCEFYLPMVAIRQIDKSNAEKPIRIVVKQPLDNSLLFAHCTLPQFRDILQLPISGLTPYYDHTRQTEYGRNPFLVVPDSQFLSFRTIIDSEMEGIVTDQNDMPTFFQGDRVRVVDGPFTGVEGYVLRYKHQLRVFVQLDCLGTFATAYVPRAYLEKMDDKTIRQ